ncbi:enoyl-CoA hydratase-related protein [Pseudoneobacillus rhizosphaerae]|uniref:Short-chain-enoyl-CoA hydratase n=1 Tax=Pseudoneobacillus rhizosphaerae TaxID=2880968 RepID=A0A9C7L950_9BACI|nr:enoyl-CoA hydratase-related protein [Pseudoneobacillus rhizosphaerae]CAG9606453.1 Short-chain-enoyl-CoA hydratase [Pseudoneobacillus rhizosphaerae]
MKNIILEEKNGIAYVTINRPEVLNCFNYDTLVELGDVVGELYSSHEARVIIFTGAGNKAFSAGADLKERRSLTESEVRRNVRKIRDVFQEIANLPQPTIAAVNGFAFGGGFELLLACDFRISVEQATMGLTEVSWGIIPGAGGTQRLTRLIGEMKAKELIFTARKISAYEAYNCGILTKVVSQNSLMVTCEKLANEILQNAPIAIRQAKLAIQLGAEVDIVTGLEIEAKAYEVTIPSKDRLEALAAFNEKRKPVFTGK